MPNEGYVELPSGWVRVNYDEDNEAYVHFHMHHTTPTGNAGSYEKLTPELSLAIAYELKVAAERAMGQAPISDGAVSG